MIGTFRSSTHPVNGRAVTGDPAPGITQENRIEKSVRVATTGEYYLRSRAAGRHLRGWTTERALAEATPDRYA